MSLEAPLANKAGRLITIVAGEASGDAHAASVVSELQRRDPHLHFSGMGGQALKGQGVQLIVDSTKLAVVGLVEVLAHYPQIRRALQTLIKHLKADRPDLLILVDYVEFNLKLARAAKKLGIKVLFYVSPQVWAWRPGRIHKIGASIDAIAVLFPFEETLYRQHGIAVRYVGNPLVDQVAITESRQQVRDRLAINGDAIFVGLFPGSRRSEVRRHLPIMVQAAKMISQEMPNVQFGLGVAPGIDDAQEIDPVLNKEIGIRKFHQQSHDLMFASDAIMVASGTATLEAGLLGTPMAVIYKVSPLSYFFLKRFLLIENIGLVNIVAGSRVVQEFIQDDARPEKIAHEIKHLLTNKAYADQVRADLSSVRIKLGEPGSASRVAEMALELMQYGALRA